MRQIFRARPAGPSSTPPVAPPHTLLAADGTEISARHEPPDGLPDGASAADLAFVVAHGFTGSGQRQGVRDAVAVLRLHGGVVTFDFRGHGRSGGESSLGKHEILDLDAAVRWAHRLGYRRVVTQGWSMGAAVAIRHGALLRGVDAVVSVSAPSRWNYRGTRPMRAVHVGVGTPLGRWVIARAYRTRVAARGWEPPPEPPDAVVGRIAPIPLLLVHGADDHYFPTEHARWLARAAGQPCELWIEPGFRHAEGGAGPDLVERIATWAERAVSAAEGRAPADPPPRPDRLPGGLPSSPNRSHGPARMPR